ncbi:membrane hypothetical protein [uncultured Gammaproteobacteria bacterium]
MSKKLVLGLTAAMVLFCSALLIGPRVSDAEADLMCVRNFRFTSFLGFSLNCDSPGLIAAALNPPTLLEEGNIRQSRPGMIYLAHLISLPLNPVISLFRGPDADKIHGPEYPLYVKSVFFEWFPVYLSYEILNFSILFLAVILYLRVVAPLAPEAWTVPAVGLLLIFNDVVKAYFWSPHMQMFNVLVPVFCIWVFVGVLRWGWFESWRILVLAGGAGLGVLAYPTFALFIPVALVPLPWIRGHSPWPVVASRATAIVVLCLAPSVVWWAYVMTTVGSYYQHEVVQYKQVVWMLEAARQGLPTLFSALADKGSMMLGFAIDQGAPALTILTLSVVVALTTRPASMATPTKGHGWAGRGRRDSDHRADAGVHNRSGHDHRASGLHVGSRHDRDCRSRRRSGRAAAEWPQLDRLSRGGNCGGD